MKDHALHFVTVFLGLFAVMNPIANTPIFLGLTDELGSPERRSVARKAVTLAFAIVAAFTLGGNLVFALFGITLPAFRIMGGLLIAMIGIPMLQGRSSEVHTPRGAAEASKDPGVAVAVSPLAFPILAGPGTIATAMSFAGHGEPAHKVGVIAAFLVLCLITYVFFLSGERVLRYLGEQAIGAMTRMMGLLLAVIGTQMVIEGIRGTLSAPAAS